MHVAPNPGPPVGKSHDVSFEREKTLMRIVSKQGAGTEAREGALVNIHLTISEPAEDGSLTEIYNSHDIAPEGLRFELGRSLHSEAVERSLHHCQPGAVIDCLCTCPDASDDCSLGLRAQKLPDGAKELWCSPKGPVGHAQEAFKEPAMIRPKPEDTEPPWEPPQYVMMFHILLDAVLTEGAVPMHMLAGERLLWVQQRKLWATELFKRGYSRRAMHHYKKALLDLETPIEWKEEAQLVERNQLRLTLHLSSAACALKLDTKREYPNLQTPKQHYDVHHDAIFHCTRVLAADKSNVKALYRRASAHLMLPADRHINGLALALLDLDRALEEDPQNAEVRKLHKRAREMQKKADTEAVGMYSKMIAADEADTAGAAGG